MLRNLRSGEGWLVLAGTSGIVGGETLCLLGPIRYEHLVHFTCHVILYAGGVCVVLGAALHWWSRQNR